MCLHIFTKTFKYEALSDFQTRYLSWQSSLELCFGGGHVPLIHTVTVCLKTRSITVYTLSAVSLASGEATGRRVVLTSIALC